jgi:hypothetical protein
LNVNFIGKLLATVAVAALMSTSAFAQTVVTNFGGNLLVNPWMEIDQLNEGSATTVTSTAAATFTYGGGGSVAAFTLGTTDGWGMTDATTSASNTLTMQNAAIAPNGSASDALVTIGTGSATRTDQQLISFEQRVEPMRIAPLQYGTANAQTSYLSFCAKASIAGNYGFYIAGGTAARTSDVVAGTSGSAYFHMFNIPTAAQFSCYQFVIPGDTGGTWLATTTTVDATHGATLGFVLDAKGTATHIWSTVSATQADGVWQNLTNSGSAAQVIVDGSKQVTMGTTSGATFELTGVKWSLDANPLAHNPELELLQAQRYRSKTGAAGVGGIAGVKPRQNSPSDYTGTVCGAMGATTAKTGGAFFKFPVNMRAAPTVTTFAPKSASAKFNDFTHTDDQLTQSADPATSSSTVGVFIQEITDAANAAGDVICIRAFADANL